ncbi:hypothetical protein OS493_033049 [Desmophyllum pertusum]|uniref:Uncharacterized protein n=1 Tax=Desmophyllum pertusum TaxID=174260 RepID=A0A9W9ZL44_9CNID|nr:hypothetical protein OS493_033049 [Desmophyllum pertusum]
MPFVPWQTALQMPFALYAPFCNPYQLAQMHQGPVGSLPNFQGLGLAGQFKQSAASPSLTWAQSLGSCEAVYPPVSMRQGTVSAGVTSLPIAIQTEAVERHTSGARDTKLTSSADNRDSESSRGETHAWESAELSVSGSQSFTTHSFTGESTDPSISCSPSAMLKRNEESWNGEERMEQNFVLS